MEIDVKVSLRAARSRVLGEMSDGSLKVQLAAIPEKGKANEELRKTLAAYLGVAASRVEIVSGLTSTRKRIRVLGR
jgi:hypothetical protein